MPLDRFSLDTQFLSLGKTKKQTRIYLIPEAREFTLALFLHGQIQAKKTDQYVWLTATPNEADQVHGRLMTFISLLDLGQSVKNSIGAISANNFQALADFHTQKNKLLICSRDLVGIPIPTEIEVKSTSMAISLNATCQLNDLYERFVQMGYVHAGMVTRPNEIAKMGGIIDIYLAHLDYPLRIEFWGNEISSLRFFDPQDQRSLKTSSNLVPTIHIPALRSEKFTGSLASYVQGKTVICEPQVQNIEAFAAVDDLSYWLWADTDSEADVVFDFSPHESAMGRMKAFYSQALADVRQAKNVMVASNQAKRLKLSMTQSSKKIYGAIFAGQEQNMEKINFIDLTQDDYPVAGFVSDQMQISFFSDHEIFGLVQSRPRSVGYVRRQYKHFLNTIKKGDLVVHSDHGICLFADVLQMKAAGIEREYFYLQFANDDKLYLPTSQIHKLSKYVGKDKDQVILDRLGGKRWITKRNRTEIDTAQIAHELLDLYAKRQTSQGFCFGVDDDLQQELADSFGYLETPDQLRAIEEVKHDMENARPMDRLICGDVGFGKTEVALRAAFKAVLSGKQVAFLCPTTILADQHFALFKSRLEQFGVNTGLVSRFKAQKENLGTLRSLAKEKIDIIIGTHRLLSQDVIFKDLGLLIVDEEQRFGVRHKERIKKMRANIDILSLSATPIPRTLHMSLIGIRDVSLIATPPKGRLPTDTFVLKYADHLVQNAIEQELARNGQVFIVYNRVKTIDQFARKIAGLAPKARIAVGHGQLESEELEEKMYSFIHGKIDVLITSTIIENGMDIPTANTIIVIGAEDFGLASLYQLRGRVGRADKQAFAYFLYRRDELSKEATKRLEAIRENSELGAGLSLAMRDLEIRGAGNILGIQQSGHIEGVGFELYSRLLKRAIRRQKEQIDKAGSTPVGNEPPHTIYADPEILSDITIELPISAYIPDAYIQNQEEKMVLYQRLSEVESHTEITGILAELIDRFGTLPAEVTNFLNLLRLRILARYAGMKKIHIKDGILYFVFHFAVDAGQLQVLSEINPAWQRERNKCKILFKKLGIHWFDEIERCLQALSDLGHRKNNISFL